ncbi:hypothetical protein I4F81_010093 [Pyropia yezoensis]|uniref:Uncharacterized protein n=1 Tax=Pyropia yezoensis TaxID=2788 RepID=A0ACC3CBP3_PYRYE|nr:hypothetical protein I4F81_010093 [Neopyropia yezoensis]
MDDPASTPPLSSLSPEEVAMHLVQSRRALSSVNVAHDMAFTADGRQLLFLASISTSPQRSPTYLYAVTIPSLPPSSPSADIPPPPVLPWRRLPVGRATVYTLYPPPPPGVPQKVLLQPSTDTLLTADLLPLPGGGVAPLAAVSAPRDAAAAAAAAAFPAALPHTPPPTPLSSPPVSVATVAAVAAATAAESADTFVSASLSSTPLLFSSLPSPQPSAALARTSAMLFPRAVGTLDTPPGVRYPVAGAANAATHPRVLRFPPPPLAAAGPAAAAAWTAGGCPSGGSQAVVWHATPLAAGMSAYVPAAEYIVRAGWVPSDLAGGVCWWCTIVDRPQCLLWLVLVRVPGVEAVPTAAGAPASGYAHLYVRSVGWQTPAGATDGVDGVDSDVADPPAVAVTAGDWMVETVLLVDAASGLVLFTGTRDSVLERHVYATALPALSSAAGRGCLPPGPRPVTRVTLPGGFVSGTAVWRPSGGGGSAVAPALVAATASSLTSPPTTVIYALVSASHDLTVAVGRAVLPALGMAALVVDGRGSGRRGRAWEAAALRSGFGGLEADDQLAAIDAAAAAMAAASVGPTSDSGGDGGGRGGLGGRPPPAVDVTRVGVVGWSYGGFLAVRLLYHPAGRVAVAVAGAPVVDWRLYDSAYTERHLGSPAVERDRYDRSSVAFEADVLRVLGSGLAARPS